MVARAAGLLGGHRRRQQPDHPAREVLMNIDATFLPIGEELVGQVFPTQISYFKNDGSGYDPSTGEVTENITQHDIPAGVLSRGRTEAGGVGEVYELRLWIHHGRGGLPALPTTSDSLSYGGVTWKVTALTPPTAAKT